MEGEHNLQLKRLQIRLYNDLQLHGLDDVSCF